MIPLSAYDDFKTASTEVMNYLHSRIGFQLWMVTRAESNDWIVLNASDRGYDVHSGDVFRWTDSFCSRMVHGLGPRIAPKSDDVPSYAAAPIGQQVQIGAYVGVPLTRANGDFFGTLCAINPQPMPQEITKELPLIEMMARLLTTILENELRAEQEHRRAEQANVEAMTDGLTRLYNRRGWEELKVREENRCQRYGHPTAVLSIDLNDLKTVNDEQGHIKGDALLKRAAGAIMSVIRRPDVAARVGGDEFAILLIESNEENAARVVQRLEEAFSYTAVSASIGMATRPATGSLSDAFEAADTKMYQQKARRKASRTTARNEIGAISCGGEDRA